MHLKLITKYLLSLCIFCEKSYSIILWIIKINFLSD